MEIKSAVFAGSSRKLADRPKERLPEFAFIGRSNVGKSSLINMLCNVKELARTSSTPGKTLLINHFKINNGWYLVDLPGYGYAKISQKARLSLAKMNNDYINESPELVELFVLLDSRHKIQKIDLEFLISLGEAGIPFSIIFTKSDKLSKTAAARQIESNKKELLEYWEELPPVFVSSAETKLGKDEILAHIAESMELVKKAE